MKTSMMAVKMVLVLVLICALMAGTWYAGRYAGIMHTVSDATFFIVDYEAPEHSPYDLTLYIEIDDQIFEHGMYIC